MPNEKAVMKSILLALSLLAAMPAQGKDLIVYLSRSHNTEAVAQIIQSEAGGDLVAIELQTPYPADYRATVEQVQRENERGYLPPLKTRISPAQYDRIFIGFPTWGMRLPPPVKSLLAAHDFGGKTVIPFNTNAGYGIGSSFDELRRLCRNCRVAEGYATEGGKERDGILFVMQGEKAQQTRSQIRRWLQKLK